ncbi:hypothetical protein OHA79_46765 (plasmid) [Streptomyces sp. NBC_00841]|uniref:hypothetical protein n=1 Tax=Streptomyces sp. NBC_00841 TaxID=2975847 RepID=UPI002DDAAD60|nr:hypothetical protein [Streptomyces sp. NBC_00841]WSA05116.1 hypothetical protein OHA79_46765 [Streptomyces sp. NBC_00841]
MTLGQQAEQGREYRAVSAGEGWLGVAALQDGQLVPEHQYLDILGRGGAGQQAQPAEQKTAESVDQTERHDAQPCADGLTNTLTSRS